MGILVKFGYAKAQKTDTTKYLQASPVNKKHLKKAVSELQKGNGKKFPLAELASHFVTPYTIDEFNKKIDRAEEDAKNGRVRTTDELKGEIKSWR